MSHTTTLAHLVARLDGGGMRQHADGGVKFPRRHGLQALIHQHHALAHLRAHACVACGAWSRQQRNGATQLDHHCHPGVRHEAAPTTSTAGGRQPHLCALDLLECHGRRLPRHHLPHV